jgi:hypothetical protein
LLGDVLLMRNGEEMAAFRLSLISQVRWCASGVGGESLAEAPLIVLRRARKRAPNLTVSDRFHLRPPA